MKINIQLDESHTQKFENIRKYYQVKNNTEVVRLMITAISRQIHQDVYTYEIPKQQKEMISEILKRGDMGEKHIYNIYDFVKFAIDTTIEKLKPLNLLSRKIRYYLSNDEQKIANAIVAIITAKDSRDCTINEIRKKLNWKPKDDKYIEQVLNRFVSRKLLLKEDDRQEIYYFIP